MYVHSEPSTAAILSRLIKKISSATIDPLPSENIYMENIFEPELYQEILTRLPADHLYRFIDHPDATLPDGTITRKLLDLTPQTIQNFHAADRDFWFDLHAVLVSNQLKETIIRVFSNSLTQRFGSEYPEMVTVPMFFRDYPGYRINVHTDAPFKVVTLQFYLPKDETQLHLGTQFHVSIGNQFALLKKNLFKPNSGYGFSRTETSWHSVEPLAAEEKIRNSLAIILYIKGHEEKAMMVKSY